MVKVIDIDPALLRRAHENFWLDLDEVSPGPGLDGREQVLFSENRRWIGQLNFVRMRSDALGQAIAVGDQLRGRANVLRLTLCNHRTIRYLGDADAYYRSVGVPAADIARGYIEFGDGASFGDGAGFALPDHDEPTLVADVPVGTTEVTLSGYIGRHLAVGGFFSINDFLYRVEANSNGVVTFNPPMREAAVAGATVDVSNPKVRVRLTDKSDWRPFCEYFRNGLPMTVNVVEAFDR